jgi:hypothetical protein
MRVYLCSFNNDSESRILSFIGKPAHAIFNQMVVLITEIMKYAVLFHLATFLGIFSGTLFAQTDSLSINKPGSARSYFGFGAGLGSCGSTWGLRGGHISNGGFGFGLSVKTNIVKNKNTPGDYYVDGNRSISPKDYLTLVSLDMIKEFSISGKSSKMGIEGGLSFTKYNIAQYSWNSGYDPNASPWFGNTHRYNKSHSATRTIGLDLRTKAELLRDKSTVIELALYSNINNLRSVIGLEVYITFGGRGK